MSRVVLDVSMSLDGFTAGPNMREAEPMGTAANASTPGWPATGPTARSSRRAPSAGRQCWRRGHRQVHLGSRCRPWGGTPWPGVPSVVVTYRASPDLLGELRLHLVPLLLDTGTPVFDGGSRPN